MKQKQILSLTLDASATLVCIKRGMKKILRVPLFILSCLAILLIDVPGLAAASQPVTNGHKPILVLVVDKLDSRDVFEYPGFQRLLNESAYGLMSIRSGAGYMKPESGYLTVGSGNRSKAPEELGGLLEGWQPLIGVTALDVWGWNMPDRERKAATSLIVPEIGWVRSQAQKENKETYPGRLGTYFRKNGWQTLVFGNSDHPLAPSRPGGLLLMDGEGKVDGGIVDASLKRSDPDFPYLSRLDETKVFQHLQRDLRPNRLVVVDYSDFGYLDYYREEMLKARYQQLKRSALGRLESFLKRVTTQWSPADLSLVVISPTISNEAFAAKRFLAPVLIRAADYPAGILTSGTTQWSGIVSNIDLLPTLLKLAGIAPEGSLDGRPVETNFHPKRQNYLANLHQRINAAMTGQRPILDWYLGLITVGWILGLLGLWFRFGKISEVLFTAVAVIPLVLISLPLLPVWSWNIAGLLIGMVLFTVLLMVIPNYENRFLILTASTWIILVADQLTGWNLIRYSAMGYSPAAGARNYGMGNEFMGTFLPVTLFLADGLIRKTRQHWQGFLILGSAILVVGLPKWGINFGGTLAAIFGFGYYVFQLQKWNLKSRKIWLLILGSGLGVLALGYWDALRSPEQQTHLGRFFRLVFSRQLAPVLLIFQRKLEMNFKLMVLSPWARIVWLSLGLGMLNRLVMRENMTGEPNRLLWRSIIVSGLAAFVFNDSGIVALATGLAFGFSYLLVAYQNH